MNNCPKCGNPLQPGQSICPICGTNIAIAPIAPVAPTPVAQPVQNVQPVATVQPVQPVVTVQPVQQPVVEPIQPVQPVATVQPIVTPVVEQQPVVEPIQPVVAPVVEETPVQPVVVETIATEPTAPVAAPVVEQPIVETQPVAETAPVEVQPVVETQPVQEVVPSNVIDAMSLPNLEQLEAKLDQESMQNNTTKPKFKVTKPMIIGCVAALIIIFGSGIALKLNSAKPVTVNPNAIQNPEQQKNKVNSNGYKFDILNSWIVVENGKDVIINNDSETVVVKLFNLKASYDTLSATQIEEYFESSEYYSKINVESITLSSEKKAVKVSAKYTRDTDSYLVEYYYINGNESLTYGLTVIYKDEQSLSDNQTSINDLAGSLSYSDDSIKVLNTKTNYAYVISAGEKIYNNYYYGIEDPLAEEYKDNGFDDDTLDNDYYSNNDSEEIYN